MHGHTLSIRAYVLVFLALLVLTGTTVAVSFVELGAFHLLVAMLIAVAKALLVVLFFMHVLSSPRLTWVVIVGAVFWFGIMLTLTLSDYLSRGWVGGGV